VDSPTMSALDCNGFSLVSAVGEHIEDLRKPSGPPGAYGVFRDQSGR
jgi:hypothetical protein